jgi:hypothetical protein
MGNQARVTTMARKTDRPGNQVSGLVLVLEPPLEQLQDTWPEIEVAALAVRQTDLTAETGVAAQVQALLHRPHQDMKVLGLARRVADRRNSATDLILQDMESSTSHHRCFHHLYWITGKYLGPAYPVAMTVCMSMFLLT